MPPLRLEHMAFIFASGKPLQAFLHCHTSSWAATGYDVSSIQAALIRKRQWKLHINAAWHGHPDFAWILLMKFRDIRVQLQQSAELRVQPGRCILRWRITLLITFQESESEKRSHPTHGHNIVAHPGTMPIYKTATPFVEVVCLFDCLLDSLFVLSYSVIRVSSSSLPGAIDLSLGMCSTTGPSAHQWEPWRFALLQWNTDSARKNAHNCNDLKLSVAQQVC